MAGRPKKEFHEYLITDASGHVAEDQYVRSPATAFLQYSVDAKDAVNHCIKYFKNESGDYYKDAQESLRYIASAMLPALMGHFETYQRYLFSGVFELSPLIDGFKVDMFFNKLRKHCSLELDPIRLAAYRSFAPVGIVLADSLVAWHDPDKVNQYFEAFFSKVNFYSKADVKQLKILWQLRHSIVHTGGTITLPDAQKVTELNGFGGKPISFEKNFILEISRKLHPLVRDATGRLENAFRNKLVKNICDKDRTRIDELFLVKSPVATWLRKTDKAANSQKSTL